MTAPESGPRPSRPPQTHTAPPSDPGEIVDVYLRDTLADLAAIRRVLARAGISDMRLDNLLDTARIAIESARPIAKEVTDHA